MKTNNLRNVKANEAMTVYHNLDSRDQAINSFIKSANEALQETTFELSKQYPGVSSLMIPPVRHEETELMKAVKANDLKTISLIRNNPKIDILETNVAGENAIHIAASEGLTEAVEILIGNDNDSEAGMIDNKCRTPLHVAVSKGHLKTAHKILSISDIGSYQWGLDHLNKSAWTYAKEHGDDSLAQKIKFKRQQAAMFLSRTSATLYTVLDSLNYQERLELGKSNAEKLSRTLNPTKRKRTPK